MLTLEKQMNIKKKKTRRHHNGGKDGYKRQDVLHEFGKCEKYEFRKTKKGKICFFYSEQKKKILIKKNKISSLWGTDRID